MTEENQENKRRRRYLHLILVPLITLAGLAYMQQQWYQTPQLIHDAYISSGYGELQARKLSGAYGDMFGATNALFSGIAMVAAISAIILQVFEFGAQREELSFANITHEQRLALDRKIFQYERSERIQNLLIDYHDPDKEIELALETLAVWSRIFRTEHGLKWIKINEVSRYRYSDVDWENHCRKEEAEFGETSTRTKQIESLRNQAKALAPLMKFLQQLSLLRPKPSELIIWKPVFDKHCDMLVGFAAGASQGTNPRPPLWPGDVNLICQRYNVFEKKGWNDKNDF